jgi:DinB superfamily
VSGSSHVDLTTATVLIQAKGILMARKLLPIEQILHALAETPQYFASKTEGLKPEQLLAAAEPGEWSLVDVLAHLRACADLWGDYIARILAEDHPSFRSVSPRNWIRRTDYPDLEFRPPLEAFTAQRADLLAILESLPLESWERAATVTASTQPRKRTVHSYAEQLARHELEHYEQIEHIANLLHHRQEAAVQSGGE